MFGAMHGTIMVFLGIVPLAFGAFGNYVTPLQIGAPDMAFPRLNMASYWVYLVGGVVMCASVSSCTSGAAETGLDELLAAGDDRTDRIRPIDVLDRADAVAGRAWCF